MRRLVLAGAAALALAGLTGCGNGSEQVGQAPGTTPAHTGPSVYSPPPQAYTPTPEPTTEAPPPPPPLPRLKKTDIDLAVKITSKHCFGSAGCNVEYNVVPTWVGTSPIHLNDDYDVTYVVIGDEDGPIIDTFEFYAKGKYEVPYEGFASTSSSSKELTARVTEVAPHLGY